MDSETQKRGFVQNIIFQLFFREATRSKVALTNCGVEESPAPLSIGGRKPEAFHEISAGQVKIVQRISTSPSRCFNGFREGLRSPRCRGFRRTVF